jgi:glycosyltransferase involved in cell wall biosynthesis
MMHPKRLRPRLFFASQSIEDPRITNLLQVRHMATAFSAYCDVTVVVKRGPGGVPWSPAIRVIRIPVARSRIGNAVFGLKAYREFQRERDRYDLVYSRNPVFSACCGRLEPSAIHVFEAHHFVAGGVAAAAQRVLYRRVDRVVAISGALHTQLVSFVPALSDRCWIAHDAHGNAIDTPQVRFRGRRPKVGYFGKLIPSKGAAMLRELVARAPEFDFYIFTPSRDFPVSSNLVAFGHLQHESVVHKMKEMDFLLLPIVPQKGPRDFSAYTSPMKLFEYLSAGSVILASNQPVVREVLEHGRNAWLLDNSVDDWVAAIHSLWSQPDRCESLRRSAVETARSHTWDARAKSILDKLTTNVPGEKRDR